MDLPKWFKRRGYRHFDRPVNEGFIKHATDPDFVRAHAFSPLIHFIKKSKRYKAEKNKTDWKERPIMFASHRDACILSRYSAQLEAALEAAYQRDELEANVIAYRKLGKGNDAFSAGAFRYATDHAPCMILAFDVTDFFGSLDHGLLKQRLKVKLDVEELSEDWYQVFKAVTRYHYIKSADLKADEVIGPRCKARGPKPIATIAEIKARGITIHAYDKTAKKGIPQGTPISASLSNLYLYDFDLQMLRYAKAIDAFYRRYSDDILFICPPESVQAAEDKIQALLRQEKLTVNAAKTERTLFDPKSADGRKQAAQYLGFAFSPAGAVIRPSSISRRWRKMRSALKRKRRAAAAITENGGTYKLSTRKLRQQFCPIGGRNFSSYARRAANTFGAGRTILKQVQRLERAADTEIRKLKAEFPNVPPPTSPAP